LGGVFGDPIQEYIWTRLLLQDCHCYCGLESKMTTTTGQSINRGSYGINILLSYSFLKAMTNITTNLTGIVLYQITTARHRETQDTKLLLRHYKQDWTHTEWITRWVMGPQVDLLLKKTLNTRTMPSISVFLAPNKTDPHDITEILLKVVLNTINEPKPI
jgi:hypothetical protein